MKRKLIGIFLSLCVALSSLPLAALASEIKFSDMPAKDNWAYAALTAAVENGLLNGSGEKLMPSKSLTRAEMATILNRAFGAQEKADISDFTDVKSTAWYADEIAKAVRMGTLHGSGGGLMRPDDAISRQEAFVVLAKAFKLEDGDKATLKSFSDYNKVSSWAASAMASMVKEGYVKGSKGALNPDTSISRAEFAQVIYNLVADYLTSEGIYTKAPKGNIVVNAPGVTLKGVTVSGDLIIGEGVGNGDVILDDVSVTGRLIVRGGGENSIHIINKSAVGSIIVGKTGDGGVRIRTEEGCQVDVVHVDDGSDDVILVGNFNQIVVNTDTPVVLKDATVTGLSVTGESASIKLEGTTKVSVTEITKAAAGTKLEVGTDSKIAKVDSAAVNVKIAGNGTVTEAKISGNNTSVDTKNTVVTVDKNTTGVIQNGTELKPVDTQPSGSNGSNGNNGNSGDSGSNTYTASVSTLAELQSALASTNVSAINISAGIIIPEEIEITFNKPVTIAAKAGAQLIINGLVTNNSTFINSNRDELGPEEDTGLVIVVGSFINNQIFINESRFGMFRANFTNNGTVTNNSWFHCGGAIFVNNGTFRGNGDYTLEHSSAFDIDVVPTASSFTNNTGATLTTEEPGRFFLGLKCAITNKGTITSGGNFESYGTIDTTNGSFVYTNYILDAGTTSGTLTPTGNDSFLETAAQVSSLDELTNALSNPATADYIAIIGNITLDSDMEFSRPVLISMYGSLTVPSGKTLTVSSASGYNELKVNGVLHIDGGTLVTTQTGDEKDSATGQVTVAGGSLKATGSYTIFNDGYILFIHGEITPDDIVIGGKHNWIIDINDIPNEAKVTTEAEFRTALADHSVTNITVIGDILLSSGLDISKPLTVGNDEGNNFAPYTLTIPSGAAITLKEGADLMLLGKIVNNGSFLNDSSSAGIFINSYGTFENNGILSSKTHIGVFEGTLENNGNITIDGNDDSHITLVGGVLDNKANGILINDRGILAFTSEGEDGAVYSRTSAIRNSGTFNNGSITGVGDENGSSGSDAYLGMMGGSITNTGNFVNNGSIRLENVALTHSGGTFDTYNSSGMDITGGSFTTTGAPDNSFHNQGYMKISDEYGKDGKNNICTHSLSSSTFKNGSKWLDYTAAVYSSDGLAAAESANTEKRQLLGNNDSYYGTSVYNRLDFKTDMTISGSKTLSAFDNYWVETIGIWDEESKQDIRIPITLTVVNGTTLTVGQTRTLHINGGILVNNGTLTTAAFTEGSNGHQYVNGGAVEVWSSGSLINNGVLTNDGELLIKYEDFGNGILSRTGAIPSALPNNTEYVATVYSLANLKSAIASDSPVFGRMEIKGNSNITLDDDHTINANIFVEPGSGLIVPYGKTLTFTGHHWMINSGDISVYGNMNINFGFNFDNHAKLEIGVINSSEAATVTVFADSFLNNWGSIIIYDSGKLDASAGKYGGADPDTQNGKGTYIPPAANENSGG